MTSPESTPPEPSGAPAPRAASLTETVRAVLWSFFGVRRGKDMQRDAVTLKPIPVVLVAIAAAALFVLALVALVKFITRHV
jgi:DUF2970 family protein